MQIQINTDNHVRRTDDLTREVEDAVNRTLTRFGNRITRVEVHLSDENSGAKTGDNDMRCAMEARIAGLQPIAVSEGAATVEQAILGAADKLERTIERSIGRLDDRKGRISHGGDQTI